ncbi:uncharacterized protein CC84DRAFT_1208443 [Paraphaeosphaeria sporulosa]|uniref:Uncharacterized protein n=1 Tax=Paraphaeosphaeria sporulosa TaxID=1460663 RepID=A0A177C6D3_9PLEO|nr:uncharacterized protein CC84DRAFT_1208443 [Paraphaeosphaeria sporulosa]OAG02439.1 hypothetical protein CC84DRAFT_1208443 [Paraphaeosphaeria sporulosa]
MLSKLLSLLALAALAVAAPQRPIIDGVDARNVHVTRDARNCTFTAQFSERCAFRPSSTTKVTYAKVSNLLTPSMSAVPVPDNEQPISQQALTVPITSRNELINGNLSIDRLAGGDGSVHFGWDWVSPASHAPEIVTWTEKDDGAETRYGCRIDQPWSKDGITCDKVDPADRRLGILIKTQTKIWCTTAAPLKVAYALTSIATVQNHEDPWRTSPLLIPLEPLDVATQQRSTAERRIGKLYHPYRTIEYFFSAVERAQVNPKYGCCLANQRKAASSS